MNPEQPLMIAFARYRQKDQSAGKITMIDIFNKQNVKVQASETDTEKQKKLYEEYKEQLTLQSNATSEEIQSRSDLYKSLQEQSGFTFDINIGLFTENLPFVVSANDRSSGIMVVCPDCMYNTIIEGHTINSYPTVYFKTTDHNQSYNQLKQVLDSRNLNKTMLRDIALEYESQVSIVFIIRVFSYGFIILMSLIAIANVFNTVSTNLILRQREFAMLKSIGLTEKGFNKMMYYECIMYGLKALMFGIPVSLLFTYWMYRQIDLVWSVGFHIPITAMLIAVFSVFTVVLITMMYAKRKINKLNLIDVIKNENV
jgi:putative ABC transport system permease protein